MWASLEPRALVLAVLALVAMLRFRRALGWTLAGSGLLGGADWWLRHGG